MKKLIAFSLILGVLGAEEDDWSLNNHFAFWGEYLHYRRAGHNHQQLIVDRSDGRLDSCGNCEFHACEQSDMARDFNFEPGWRVGVGYMTKKTTWEATYMRIQEWQGTCRRHASGSLFFSERHSTDFNDWTRADRGKVTWKSRFEDGEFNYFRFLSDRKGDYFSSAWMAGVRYIYVPESFEARFIKGGNRSTYHVSTYNHLYGVHAGGSFQWNPTRTLSWDFAVKIGVGWDFARNRVFQGDFNDNVTLRHYSATKNAFPFIADGAFTGIWQPYNSLNFHVGYQLIYLSGICTAPDQVVKHLTNDHHIRTIGEMLVYGLFAGATLSF